MGHYTGIAINVKLRSDITPEQVDILEWITSNYPVDNDNDMPPPPDREHPMFKDQRWTGALCGQSAYLDECEKMQPPQGQRLKRLSDGRFLLRAAASSRSYILMEKLFPEWLAPLVDPSEYGKIVGEYRYEYTMPTKFGYNADGIFREEQKRTPKTFSFGYDDSDPDERDLYVDMTE